MGCFGLIPSTKKGPILSHLHSHPGGKLRTVFSFLSAPCLPFFFICKENSCLAEGAQLRRSLAAQRAQQGAAGPPNPFPGKMWAAGQILKLLRHRRGASSGVSQCNRGHLVRR